MQPRTLLPGDVGKPRRGRRRTGEDQLGEPFAQGALDQLGPVAAIQHRRRVDRRPAFAGERHQRLEPGSTGIGGGAGGAQQDHRPAERGGGFQRRQRIRRSMHGDRARHRWRRRWPADHRPRRSPQPVYPSFAIVAAVSSMRLEKPHSLSYQDSTRTKEPSTTWVWPRSKIELAGLWLKSEETSGWSLVA